MLSVGMNNVAVAALGGLGVEAAVPLESLAPELRELVADGVMVRDGVLVFAKTRTDTASAPGFFSNLTLWECSVSSFHLDDVVPVEIGVLDDFEPVISEADQVLMLRHGLGFALRIVQLVAALPDPVPVRCIVGANSTNGTFRFHRARAGQTWLHHDVDAYLDDKIIVVDGGPASLGGIPW